jgi:hypothetical protein
MITHWQAVQEIALARGWTLQMLGVPHNQTAPHTPQLTSPDGYYCLIYLYGNATRVAMVSTATRGFTFLSYEDALRIAAGDLTYGELAPAPVWEKYKPPGYIEAVESEPEAPRTAATETPEPTGYSPGGLRLSPEERIESYQR